MHYWGWDQGWGWGMGWMMLAWPLLLLAFVAISWYFLAGARPGGDRPPPDSPELLLKRRYARGEIDREEYERRLEDIRR